MSPRLALPQVTLCAASSINLAATLAALEASMAGIDFGACLLFTDAPLQPPDPAITIVRIPRLASGADYSHFLLGQLADHINTPYALVVQWDGHVVDPGRWRAAFLDHDYVGAGWPQFDDGHDVGNGGFSLRSRRLLTLCQAPRFRHAHPEDLAIGRWNRAWLEGQGVRFAPRALADAFSAERAGDPLASFGYHGVWHMPRVLGGERFWQLYQGLDDRSTVSRDRLALARQLAEGPRGLPRALLLLTGGARAALGLAPGAPGAA